MSTAIHWTLLKPVSLKALCGDGNSKIQAIKAAETKKERTSHGLIPRRGPKSVPYWTAD